MFPLIPANRHVLKYLVACPLLDQLLVQNSYCSFHSKSPATSTVSKPIKTKKKYSELPTLHALSECPTDAISGSQIILHTHLTLHSHECASFAMPNAYGRLLTSLLVLHLRSQFVFNCISAVVTACFTLRVNRFKLSSNPAYPQRTRPTRRSY